MANTYTRISSNVLSSSAASVTFSAIPSTYRDLVLRASVRVDRAGFTIDGCLIQFNSDTGTNYSTTWISGNGTSPTSDRFSTRQYIEGLATDAATATAGTFASWEIYIPSYAGAQNKPLSSITSQENNGTTATMRNVAGLWRNTAAITSMTFTSASSSNFVSGSSFYLYGIKNT